MKTLKLKQIIIEHFEGTTHRIIDFAKDGVTIIEGDNETGKSSVMNAFFWVFANRHPYGSISFSARPKDVETGELLTDLITKVTVHCEINNMPTSFAKTASGGKNSVIGYEVNGVPYGRKMDFDNKLNEICDADTFALLCSPRTFNQIAKIEQRRALLMSLAGNVDYTALESNYPAISQALASNKSVKDLKLEMTAKRKDADGKLKNIPSLISENEMKVDTTTDFAKVQKELESKKKELSDIDTEIAGSAVPVDLTAQNGIRKQISDIQQKISEKETLYNSKERDERRKIDETISQETYKLSRLQKEKELCETDLKTIGQKLESQKNGGQELEGKLKSLQNMTFEPDSNAIPDKCNYCDRPYSASDIALKTTSLEEDFNYKKSKDIEVCELSIDETLDRYKNLKADYEVTFKALESVNVRIENATNSISEAKSKLSLVKVASAYRDEDTEYAKFTDTLQELNFSLSKLSAPVDTSDIDQLKSKKETIQGEINNLTSQLFAKDNNESLQKRVIELKQSQSVYAQTVSDCDNVLEQIKDYNKQKLTIVENSVNTLFSTVKFKLFEDNITNDEQKEICDCTYKGVTYGDTLNKGATVAAGVEIVNAFAKKMELNLPLFIDDAEGCFYPLQTDAQLIKLVAIEKAPFKVIHK